MSSRKASSILSEIKLILSESKVTYQDQ